MSVCLPAQALCHAIGDSRRGPFVCLLHGLRTFRSWNLWA